MNKFIICTTEEDDALVKCLIPVANIKYAEDYHQDVGGACLEFDDSSQEVHTKETVSEIYDLIHGHEPFDNEK